MYRQKGINFGAGTGSSPLNKNGDPKKETRGSANVTKNIKKKAKSSSKGTGLQNLKGGEGKSSFDLKGYLKGEQGYIPDYKGKPTRQAANENTFLNPKSSNEVMADQADSREHTRLMKEEAARKKSGKKTSKSEAAYLKSNRDKSKQTRPNRKDRY